MVVEEFSSAGFLRKMQHKNLEKDLSVVWEQSKKTAKKILLNLKCFLEQFDSVNKLNSCEANWEGNRTCLQELQGANVEPTDGFS